MESCETVLKDGSSAPEGLRWSEGLRETWGQFVIPLKNHQPQLRFK